MTTLRDGMLLSVAASIYVLTALWANPRLFLRHCPKAVRDVVPPASRRERNISMLVGIPFILLLVGAPVFSTIQLQKATPSPLPFWILFTNTFGVASLFNLVDLLILDWLLVCYFTPAWVVLPGSEHLKIPMPYFDHFRGFLIGTALSLILGLIAGSLL